MQRVTPLPTHLIKVSKVGWLAFDGAFNRIKVSKILRE